MTTWQSALDLEPPIRGHLDDYENTWALYRDLATSSGASAREFASIIAERGTEQLGGQSATMLVSLVTDLAGSIAELPRVADDVAEVFNQHARTLDELVVAETGALTRLGERAARLANATTDHETAARRHRSARYQLAHVSPDDDEARQRWSRNVSYWGSEESRCAVRRANAHEELGLSRVEHRDLQHDEADLIARTVAAVEQVRLGSLADPGVIETIAHTVSDFVIGLGTNVVDAVADLVDAVVDGDFDAALWALSDLVDAVSDLGIILTFVLAPGVLAAFTAATAIAKIVTTVTLAVAQSPNPETGHVVTGYEALSVSLETAALASLSFIGSGSSTSAAGQRSIVGNVRQRLRPRSSLATGRRHLYGAARASSRRAAGRQIVSDLANAGVEQALGAAFAYGRERAKGTKGTQGRTPHIFPYPSPLPANTPVQIGPILRSSASTVRDAQHCSGRSDGARFHMVAAA